MALEYAHGAIQWLAADGVSTVYTVSGLSFQPKAIKCWTNGLASATDAVSETTSSRRSIGFGVSTTSRRAVASSSIDNSGSAACTNAAYTNQIVVSLGNGVTDGLLDLNSITSDGFTLIVDDQNTVDLTVFWEAWGGSDITVAQVGAIEEPGSTGNANYTVAGFASTDTDDQVVMLAGCRASITNSPGSGDSAIFFGVTTGSATAENVVVLGGADDGSATMDTDGYCKTGECLAMLPNGSGDPEARATCAGFGTDLFTLNWIARASSGRENIYLAIKGGNWRAGSYTINGNTGAATATVSGLPFTPIGLSLFGRMSVEQAAGTADVNDRMSLGCGSATTDRRAMGHLDENATGNTEIDFTIQYDQILAFPSTTGTLQAAYDINAMNADGFQIIVDTAGGVASEWQGYLTFGNVATSTDMKWIGSYPDQAPGAEFRRASLLALIDAEPIRPPTTPTISGTILGTVLPPASLLQYQDLVAPLTIVADVPKLAWEPEYPNRIWRTILPLADHPWLFTGVTSSTIFSTAVWWRGIYPDRIDPSRSLPTPEQQAFALPPFQTFADLRWVGIYPAAIDRLRFTAERQLAFTTGQTGSTIPIRDLRWQGAYPDRIWRTVLPTGATPFLWLWSVPIAPATRVFAWAVYPDRIVRVVLPTGVMPAFVPGPIVPIPGVGGLEEDRIHLGTKEAYGVSSQPIFGGW